MNFCNYWDDHTIFKFHSVIMVYCVYWFAYIEPSFNLVIKKVSIVSKKPKKQSGVLGSLTVLSR